jgi:acylphosphatase
MNVQCLFSILKRISFIYENNYLSFMERVKIVVYGIVQGVFFRASVRDIALDLGLKGYAKNMDDGSVKVVAEGPNDKLKKLVEYCKNGPRTAEVEKIEVKFGKNRNKLEGFKVQ